MVAGDTWLNVDRLSDAGIVVYEKFVDYDGDKDSPHNLFALCLEKFDSNGKCNGEQFYIADYTVTEENWQQEMQRVREIWKDRSITNRNLFFFRPVEDPPSPVMEEIIELFKDFE